MDKQIETINQIRKFNRFYTVNMGFLNANYLGGEYSVAETRILFEMNIRGMCTQSDIVKILHIDKSYLSRIIGRFCAMGLAEKIKAEDDKRCVKITLTEKGKAETERLIELTNSRIGEQIARLSVGDCDLLCGALNTAIEILEKGEKENANHSI
ncbi:MAG: MarR family winged helix-turn-helix transcriptional regulator [Clostridia bacterium]|nr:MarR family winged helix-turn-helix transcriptional regulator [Clostridia bacterium]